MADEHQIVQPEKRPSVKKHFVVMFVLATAVLGLAVYANMWKESRRVASVVAEGNAIVSTRDILALAQVPANSLLFDLDLYAIEQRVLKNEYVKSVAVHRDIPNRVRIVIEERTPVAAMVAERLYYLDAEGFVLPSVRSPHIFDLPVLTGSFPSAEIRAGKQTRNHSILDALYILSVAKEVDEEMYRNISELHLQENRGFVFYTSESGIPVIFGRGQAGTKLVLFDGFWKSIVTREGAQGLQYIDLRFDDRVVVRWSTASQGNRQSSLNHDPA